jgi:hypothetical protein
LRPLFDNTVTVVASVSRASCLAGVIENFNRQQHPAHLIIVLNGPAREHEVDPSPRMTVLRVEGGAPARARNPGLAFAQERRAGMVAFWDDDDYYGPGYLTEVAESLRDHPRRVVGKVVRYVEFDDGVYLFMRKQGGMFLGGTVAGWASGLPPFPDLPCHEDHEWCRLLEKLGFELHPLSGLHYLYNRKAAPHAWQATRTQMLACYGPAFVCGPACSGIAAAPVKLGGYVPCATLDEVEKEFVALLLARQMS